MLVEVVVVVFVDVIIDPWLSKVKGVLGIVGLEIGIGGPLLTLLEKFVDVTDMPVFEPALLEKSFVEGVEIVWTMVFVVFLIETV